MDKKLMIVLLILVFFTPIAKAQVSLGIWPARFEIETPVFTTNSVYLFVFNPGNKDVDVQMKFNCKNCVQDLKILNFNLGKNTIEPEIEITPSEMTIEKNTSIYEPENFTLKISNSLLIKNRIKLGNITIPYWSLNFGKRELEGDIEVTTTSTKTFVTITSKGKIVLDGIDVLVFSLVVSVIVLLAVTGVYLHYKRMKV